jgi:hypothetical protein
MTVRCRGDGFQSRVQNSGLQDLGFRDSRVYGLIGHSSRAGSGLRVEGEGLRVRV